MDILSKLPGLKDDATPEEVDEAEAKRQRIDFHRRMVRNGPANFKSLTNGQVRRARKRALDGETKKARRRQVRQWRADRAEAATLRGYLQAAAVLPYGRDFEPSGSLRVLAITHLVQRFADPETAEDGRIHLTREVVVGAIEKAWQRYLTLNGRPVQPLSPAYVLPVALAADEA